jgi:hypothetical protein
MASPPNERQDAEQRMLGAVPGVPALGRGPAANGDYSRHEYHHPAAGWGAAPLRRAAPNRSPSLHEPGTGWLRPSRDAS